MSRWRKIEVHLPDYGMRLWVKYWRGWKANLDEPAEPDDAEIIEGTYEDGMPIPDELLNQIDTDTVIQAVHRGDNETHACRKQTSLS